MKKFVLTMLILSLFFADFCAQYGNEWIDYSQQYYTFPIAQTGLKRINYDALAAASIPIGTFNHDNIQIFARETEVPLYIELNGDGIFNSGDYILFYAQKNDSWLDAQLYNNPNGMANPDYSLVNDTILYFFTWNSSTSNLRFTLSDTTGLNSYTPATYVWNKYTAGYTNQYYEGAKATGPGYSMSTPVYSDGEGYGLNHANGVSGYSLSLNAATPDPFVDINAPDPRYQVRTTSNSDAETLLTTDPNHHIQYTFGNYLAHDEKYRGFKQIIGYGTFPNNELTASTPFKWTIVGDLPVATDFQGLTYWHIEYPRLPSFSNATSTIFKVPHKMDPKIRLDLSSLNVTNPIALVFGEVPQIVQLVNQAGVWKGLLTPEVLAKDVEMVVYSLSAANQISSFNPVNGTGLFTDYSSEDLESALLMIYPTKLANSVNDYATYRSSIAGGSYNTKLFNIEELYLQFGGGIVKHIAGIRRFARYVNDLTTQKPVGLFIIGKGITTVTSRTNPIHYQNNLVPTFGFPSSDVAITSRQPGTTKWRPLIPTGRIAATTDQEVLEYLDKIKDYDLNQNQLDVYDTPNKDWQKQVLHFVGGTDASQQIAFQSYMRNIGEVIEDDYFAGNIRSIEKNSSLPLDPSTLADIVDRISDGVSLITFFGHNGVGDSGFEINLDEPANWDNKGKYPIMLVNSCYNGNIFAPSLSYSEKFVKTPEAGPICYIATTSTGFAHQLYVYSLQLYREISLNSYGKTIAENMQNAISAIEPINDIYYESTALDMTLNGDPMIRANWHENPEIELLEENVFFTPTEIDLNTDSITVNIALKNLGHSIRDTFNLEVTRNFPGSTIDSLYFIQINGLDYMDTIKLNVPLQPNVGIGLNTFTIKADIPTLVTEQYDEVNNNQITKNLLIDIDAIVPVYPWEFAVVPKDTISLVASTINPIADYGSYRFEIDTIDSFDSPEFRFATKSGLGGVFEVAYNEWNTPLIMTDSTVYFWRVAVDEPSPTWRNSSFQYIEGKEGWGQDHFHQFKKNTLNAVTLDFTERNRDFNTNNQLLECFVFNSASLDNRWLLNFQQKEYATCGGLPQIHVAVIDPTTMEAWGTNNDGSNPAMSFGNINDGTGCRSRKEYTFIFLQNSLAQLEYFQGMISAIPDGHYVLIYTPVTADYTNWNALDSTDMYNLFATHGATNIVATNPNLPFAFFFQKGNTSTAVEEHVTTPGGSAYLSAFLQGSLFNGQETSTFIGPASNWGTIYWKQDSLETPTSDTTYLQIQGYSIDQTLSFVTGWEFTSNDSLLNLNSILDANQYPYIKLKAFYEDTLDFTPANIDRWHVLYTPLPEAAIDGTSPYTFLPQDTLNEGQEISFAVDVRNIFTLDMDSLLVNYWVEDANHIKHPLTYPRTDSLRVGQTIRDTLTFSTLGLSGLNSLWMEVNPYINGSLYITDQPEQMHFNNILQVPFYVIGDDEHPILDVTFDGRHILNGDIVSPASEVLITLKDENPYLVMDDISDTTHFGIYLTDPNGTQRRIPFVDGSGQTIMQWVPAEAQFKKFKIIYPAAFELNGTYTLLVQGSDRSGNLSGDFDYKITFEVVRESSITNMMNYPNPFSTSTAFVFTLTGTEVPDDILIQVMTVSGKVVREISEDELGPIHIGRNITDFKWDGRDQFGDQLANGVYLYRVKVRLNGEEIKRLETDADQYFTKDFGKMYLMR